MVEQVIDPTRNHRVQRIYIGGINPNRGLTVAEVWQRLEAKLTNPGESVPELQWSDVYRGSCYLQFTAVNDVTDPSPLTIVKSWFHNVMWKGCKLVVDEARPHFLQRLQDERHSRQVNECDSDGTENTRSQDATNLTELQQLSRYWKVRRGYCGEPVKHVDTQSSDVTSWAMFTRIRQRHQKQQEKDRLRRIELLKGGTNMTVKEAQKRAYYNRSIRLIFPDDIDTAKSLCTINNELSHDGVTSSDQSVDNSSEDDTNDSIETGDKIQTKVGKYVWSDDDSDSAEIDEDLENGQANVNSSSSLQHNNVADHSAYIWSDDDNASDNDISTNLNKRKYSKPHDLDEFESALDMSQVDSVNVNVLTASSDNKNHDMDFDLTIDVERNLSILAQLFPETSKVPSIPHTTETIEDKRDDKHPPSTPLMSSGWGASGQMLRFDPSQPQSTNLLLHDDIATGDKMSDPEKIIDQSDSSQVDNETNQSNHIEQGLTDQNQTNEAPEATTAKGVYEQKKLEQVFKEAREGVPIISSERIDAGAPFAFGFELSGAENLSEEPVSSSSFSFNFGINATNQETVGAGNLNEIGIDGNMIQEVESSTCTRPRFLAFEFPNETVLNELVHNFYQMNDGERIISDVDGWRNDPSVKDKWLKERLALTQDWKRKKKFALSKKQKRNQKG